MVSIKWEILSSCSQAYFEDYVKCMYGMLLDPCLAKMPVLTFVPMNSYCTKAYYLKKSSQSSMMTLDEDKSLKKALCRYNNTVGLSTPNPTLTLQSQALFTF